MKASLFCAARYIGEAPHDVWPPSGEYYSGDAAMRSMQTSFDRFRCAEGPRDRLTSFRPPDRLMLRSARE